MKKVILVLIIIAAIGGSVALLMYNKSQSEKKAKSVEVLKEFPVSVESVRLDSVATELAFVGSVAADKEVSIVSETQGRITHLGISQGQSVGKGRLILAVDNELKAAALQTAEASLDKAKKDYERNKQLFEEKSVSQAALENCEYALRMAEAQHTIAKRQLADTKLFSPVSGIVATKNVEVGSVISPGMVIANIVDISRLKIKVNIPERDVFKLKVNDPVSVETDIYPDAKIKGKIQSISPKADEAHAYQVEVALSNNREYPLKAGMFARVKFDNVIRSSSLIISRGALVGSIRDPKVYVVQNGVAYLKSIVVGSVVGNTIEIVKGLQQGEQVVVSGQLNLKDNTKVIITK